MRPPTAAATRSDRACGRWPTTAEPLGPRVCTWSMVTASPPPNTSTLVPSGAAAASWVATARVPAGATVSLTGKKRDTLAEEFPPIRPPRTRKVCPSRKAWARLTGVGSPLTMALTDNVGGVAGAVGDADADDGGSELGRADAPLPGLELGLG